MGGHSSWWSERSRDGGVDEIPLRKDIGGRLFLCGKHVVGPDPIEAMRRVDATTIVCLTERHEIEHRYPDYTAWLDRSQPARAVWFPIPDLHAPTATAAIGVLDQLLARLDSSERLLMHCAAGKGRAGTMAVGVLIGLGWSLDESLERVASCRPLAGPEVGVQLDLVRELSQRWGGPIPPSD